MRREVQGVRCEACPGHRSGVRRRLRWTVGLGQALLLLAFWSPNGWGDGPPQGAEHHHHPVTTPTQKMPEQAASETPHPHPGTPKGWRFTLPDGDPKAGRQAFADFECFKCHEVHGEDFPAPQAEQGDVGSTLSGMGGMHPAEYFVEIMIDPNASAIWRIKHHKAEHKGYLGPDGTSKMPSYNDTMTVQQLIDIVAYMKSLTVGGHQH